MNFMEANIHAIEQVAKESSAGENIDKHWKHILPEVIDFAGNEIFLILYRAYINVLMKQNAARFAQTFPPRDIGNLNNAELWLHTFTRQWQLTLSEDRGFQALVDQHQRVIYNTTDPVVWVKPSRIWLPHFAELDKKIYLSLVERYKQFFFARRCWTELMHRARQDPYIKHTFMLVVNPTRLRQDFYRERTEANQWLCNASRRIATNAGIDPAVGEDAQQDWLEKLFPLPLHEQIEKARATGKAIRQGAIDMQRKGGQYEHVPFDDHLTNTMPDGSTKDPSAGMIADEIPQRLLECQPQIEGILSQGRPEKRKQGKRRFKVMQLLVYTPTLTSSAIANQLRTSEPTICRDRKVIEQSRDRIKEILHG